MGYLFKNHLQRKFYNREFLLDSLEDDCLALGIEDIHVRGNKAVTYNTFLTNGVSSTGNREEEKLCSQFTKNSNSKIEHKNWSNLKKKRMKNYRLLKKPIRRGRVP